MSLGWILALAGLLPAAAATAGEVLWRSRVGRGLSEEVRLGVLAELDYRALVGFARFRRSWIADGAERRVVRRLAGRLARARLVQGRSEPDHGRLLQVEILSLRTRLRGIRRAEPEITPPDGLPAAPRSRTEPASETR
jgi:hypothetical protein